VKINHYETLGVGESATDDEIKRAFRERAKAHHPDRNPGDADAGERFKQTVAAYDILNDAVKRVEYDLELRAEREAARSEGAARAARAVASGTRTPTSPAPSPQSRSGPSAGIVFGIGLLGLMALDGIFGGGGRDDRGARERRRPSPHWDSRAGRYRRPDGRFTSL
jgi:DnaJ-class molecular chaperone